MPFGFLWHNCSCSEHSSSRLAESSSPYYANIEPSDVQVPITDKERKEELYISELKERKSPIFALTLSG